jgi:hypothetical protein
MKALMYGAYGRLATGSARKIPKVHIEHLLALPVPAPHGTTPVDPLSLAPR